MSSPPPVLLVEDDAMYRLVTTEMLRRMGCRVRAVANGNEAIAAARGERFEIVLLNVHMAEMDGFEVSRRVRADVKSGAPPRFVAMLVDASDAERALCLAEGMTECIAKPVRIAALERVILGTAMTEAPRAETGVNEILDGATIDELILLDGASGGLLLDRLATSLRLDVTDRVDEARWAVGAADAGVLKTAAEKLCACASAIGATRLYMRATQLEMAANRGTFGDVEAILTDVLSESVRALRALERVIKHVNELPK